MSKRMYDSETGDIMEQEESAGVPAFDPLRVPGIVEQFMTKYIPAPDERTATDVLSLGSLRECLCAFVAFGSKEDLLNDYLMVLANEGYILQNTSSGPAMCLIERDSPRVINVYDDAEDVTP